MKKRTTSFVISMGLLATSLFSLTLSDTARAANIGPDQELYISTSPVGESSCLVTDSAGSWVVDQTPAHLNIMKSGSGIDVQCRSNDGLWSGKQHFDARFSPQSLAGAIYGGISSGAKVLNNGSDDGAGAEGYWTQTKTNITIRLHRETPIIKSAEVVDNNEALEAAPKASVTPRHHMSHHCAKGTVRESAKKFTCSFE